MALKSQSATRAMLDAANALGNSGTLVFYSGAVPGTADAAAGPVLGSLTMSATAFNAATGTTTASATLAGVPKTVAASGDGTPTYARLLSSGGTPVEQYTVGGGQEITFDSYTWVTGGTINLTSLTVTLPVA